MPVLPTILLILAAFSIGATVIAFVVSWRSAREARSTLFPIVREEETVRSRRARAAGFALMAMTAVFLGGWLATLRLAGPAQTSGASGPAAAQVTETSPPLLATATPASAVSPPPAEVNLTETAQPAEKTLPATASPVATIAAPAAPLLPTLSPTAMVEATLSPAPTASPSLVPPTATPTETPVPPTATPTETPVPPTATPPPTEAALAVRLPTMESRTPAPPEVRMGPIQFATGVTADVKPINPGQVFSGEVESVYAIFPYSGMENGLSFAAVWYRNGAELWRDDGEWQWGDKAQSYRFLNPPGPGLYKLELYVNDSVVATDLFEIR